MWLTRGPFGKDREEECGGDGSPQQKAIELAVTGSPAHLERDHSRVEHGL